MKSKLNMKSFMKGNGGFGMNELLGIAAALIIAAFVIIPSLRTFAENLMDGLAHWWDTVISGNIFPDA